MGVFYNKFKYFIFTIIPYLFLFVLFSCDKSEGDMTNRNNNYGDNAPKLYSFCFLASDNTAELVNDIEGEIIGDSIVECWSRHIIKQKKLIPRIKWGGQFLQIDRTMYVETNSYDFTKPVEIKIVEKDSTKIYKLYLHSFTGLPIVRINTNGYKVIDSKEQYVRASFILNEDVVTRGAGDYFEDSVSIKGRGNFTWVHPKKPYRLKFDSKVSLLGMPKDKSWVLLANYTDRTFLRNYIAFYMGQMSNLEYTPRCYFVELILNGIYNGTYLLTEKLKIANHRVNVGDNGFLLEIDGYAKGETDARWFETKHLSQVVNIKDPDVEYDDDNFNYVRNYVLEAEAALYSDNFRDKNEGWQRYLDVNTFVDWYLINEICKNMDAFRWSAFLTLTKGGKLKMGPLWDFDNSLKWDYVSAENDFFVSKQSWYSRLFEDTYFESKVKERFQYFYNKRFDIFSMINGMSHYLQYSYEEDYRRWGVDLYQREGYGNMDNEVQLVKQFLQERFEWLNSNMNKN